MGEGGQHIQFFSVLHRAIDNGDPSEPQSYEPAPKGSAACPNACHANGPELWPAQRAAHFANGPELWPAQRAAHFASQGRETNAVMDEIVTNLLKDAWSSIGHRDHLPRLQDHLQERETVAFADRNVTDFPNTPHLKSPSLPLLGLGDAASAHSQPETAESCQGPTPPPLSRAT